MTKSLFTNLVVLGAAIVSVSALVFVTGCSNASIGAAPTPSPTSGVSVAANSPAVIGENSVKASLAWNVKVANTNGSDTAFTCASSDANVVTINDASTCTGTMAKTGSGDATITVTAHADTAKTATFIVHVGNYVLMESSAKGLQLANVDKAGSAVSILLDNKPLTYVSWFPDHHRIAGLDYNLNKTVINIYVTDGTANGTVLDHKIDLTTFLPGRAANFIAVSPDGTKIVFVTAGEPSHGEGIYTVSATADAQGNTAAPTLIHMEAENGMLAVSGIWYAPDGTIMVEDVTTKTVFAMNGDGTNWHQLISVLSTTAMYSPDMKTLYYANFDGGVWFTYVKDVATGNILNTLPGYLIVGVAPNGSGIIITNGTNIFRANADGTGVDPSSPVAVGGRGSW